MEKILLITGASSEVGISFINEYVNNFDKVICHYSNNDNELKDIKNRYTDKIILLRGDFQTEAGIDDFLRAILDLGVRITHILHLSSIKSKPIKFHKTLDIDFSISYNVSVLSIIKILKKILPDMINAKYGKVVFLLSSFTTTSIPKYQSPYVLNKYALYGLMRNLSNEYIDKGIRFNAISPQMMETKFLSDTPELIVKQNAMNNPFGTNLTVKEILSTINYLLSSESDAIVGENISITRGGI